MDVLYTLLEELEEIEILSLTYRLRARAFEFRCILSGACAGGADSSTSGKGG